MNQCNLEAISTDKAPKAVGPYSQAIISDNLLFISGQIPIDPKTNTLINDDFNKAVIQVCENIKSILIEAKTSFENVIKTTVFISDINNFSVFNDIYATYFISKPARSLVEVSNLPKGSMIEIEVIAKIK